MRRTFEILMLVLALAALVAGCAKGADGDHPAVVAVRDLLELRRDDVRDPAAYEVFFEDSDLVTALVEGSGDATGTPQVPAFEDPYLSAETSSTADVAVVWVADEAFVDWPTATVFVLSLDDDRWVVVDALEATSAPEPLGPSEE